MSPVLAPSVAPVIDLAAPRATVVNAVRAASRDRGLFAVINHGVPDALIAAQFALARAFFALDDVEKRRIAVDGSNCFRGYEPFGTQTIDDAAPGDLKEGFIAGPDLAADHPHVRAGYPNTGANRWPLRPAGFRDQMDAYIAAMNGLGRRLAALIALSLGLSEEYFAAGLREPLTYSQLFHYPSLPVAPGADGFGAGAHRDWGLLTILLQDDVGGLEQVLPGAGWQPVPPVPGSFVIILGELLVRITEGRYRSALHRVRRNTSGRSRYAMPTFFDPGYDERVACVPTCLPAVGAPRYAACTVAEHMREMARATLSPTAGG